MKPLSASQLELFVRCPRRWAFRYRTNLPKRGFTAQTSLGTDLHTANENYLTKGLLPVVDTQVHGLFMQGLPYLPPHAVGESEKKFTMTVDGISFMGYMDWYAPGAVYDYKTSSDPVKYGLQGRNDFLTHVQPLMYATFAQQEAESVYMGWIYYKTKGKPKAYRVEALLGRDEILAGFETVVATPARKLVSLNVVNPNELDANRDACNDYHVRCEYFSHCSQDEVPMAERDLLADMMALAGDDTSAAPEPAADPINRTKRVSTQPPVKHVTIVASAEPIPAPVKTLEQGLVDAFTAPNRPDRVSAPTASPLAIILEELSAALNRAAERIK